MTDKRLIVALDYPSLEEAKKTVALLGDHVDYYKVGMELYYSAGTLIIDYLREKNKQIFLDLKLHDIPNTVARSAAALTKLGVSMLNVHASGGPAMMRAAAEAVAEEAEKRGITKPRIIAVTILTSINPAEWIALRQHSDIQDQAQYLAELAQRCRLDGVVASAQEAQRIREVCGPAFEIVTPGIRPTGTASNDQSRITTPKAALLAGASHIVVGRPITAAADPVLSAGQIIKEMRNAQ